MAVQFFFTVIVVVAVVLVNVLICISANVQETKAVSSAIFQIIISQGKLKL
jgi:hypothetical protein